MKLTYLSEGDIVCSYYFVLCSNSITITYIAPEGPQPTSTHAKSCMSFLAKYLSIKGRTRRGKAVRVFCSLPVTSS